MTTRLVTISCILKPYVVLWYSQFLCRCCRFFLSVPCSALLRLRSMPVPIGMHIIKNMFLRLFLCDALIYIVFHFIWELRSDYLDVPAILRIMRNHVVFSRGLEGVHLTSNCRNARLINAPYCTNGQMPGFKWITLQTYVNKILLILLGVPNDFNIIQSDFGNSERC